MSESECMEYAQALAEAKKSSERIAARKELRAAIRSAVDSERMKERERCAKKIERLSVETYAVLLCEHKEAADWLRSNSN